MFRRNATNAPSGPSHRSDFGPSVRKRLRCDPTRFLPKLLFMHSVCWQPNCFINVEFVPTLPVCAAGRSCLLYWEGEF